MKKTFMLVVVLAFVVVSVGAVTNLTTLWTNAKQVDNGKVVYTEYKDVVIAKYEPVYKTVYDVREVCQDRFNNVSRKYEYGCYTINVPMKVLDTKIVGEPIYEEQPTRQISVEGKTYEFNEKGCWVCGQYIACLSIKDGYSENRGEEFKCDEYNYPIIRSGESGWIENVKTKARVYTQSDVGVIE